MDNNNILHDYISQLQSMDDIDEPLNFVDVKQEIFDSDDDGSKFLKEDKLLPPKFTIQQYIAEIQLKKCVDNIYLNLKNNVDKSSINVKKEVPEEKFEESNVYCDLGKNRIKYFT